MSERDTNGRVTGTMPEEPTTTRFRALSPSALVAFTACVHRTELERAREAELVERPHFADSTLEALIARGREHEQAFLADLRGKDREVLEISTADLKTRAAVEEAARLTH